MQTNASPNNLRKFTNAELFAEAKAGVTEETKATLHVLHVLKEIDRRRAYAEKSYPSLFDFCVEYLGYKKGAAYRRVNAMRALKALPELEEKVQQGTLNLTTLAQAQSFFKEKARDQKPLCLEEKRDVFKTLENKSTRETDKYFLELSPDLPPKEKIKEIQPEVYQWTVTLPQEVKDLIEQYRKLLGPDGNNLENMEVIRTALKEAIRLKAEKVPAPGKMGVKRIVWHRDQGRCTYRDPETKLRCTATQRLEVDHAEPKAFGGSSTPENLRLLCKSHNTWAAIQVYGLNKMDRFINGDNS